MTTSLVRQGYFEVFYLESKSFKSTCFYTSEGNGILAGCYPVARKSPVGSSPTLCAILDKSVAQLAERQSPKLKVAGSMPV